MAETIKSTIQGRNSSRAVQTQAANMKVLADEIAHIDISPLKHFAGLGGRVKYYQYVTDMAQGKEVPKEFRDYEAFKNITSYLAMDALRKGFQTSVVPDYVRSTLGKASNPNSTWWHDPIQVEREWKATADWVNHNSELLTKIATRGLTAGGNENNNKSNNNTNMVTFIDSEGNKQQVAKSRLADAREIDPNLRVINE
jgi:hypothetical protein